LAATVLTATIRGITSLVEARLRVFEAVSAVDEREACLQAINTSSSGEQTRSLIASMTNLDMLALTAIKAWQGSLPWWKDARFIYRGDDYVGKIKAQQALFEASSRPGSPSPSPSRQGADSTTPSNGTLLNGSSLYPPTPTTRPGSAAAPLANLGVPRYQPPMTVFESPLPPPSPLSYSTASSSPPSRARSAAHRSPRTNNGIAPPSSPARASTAATATTPSRQQQAGGGGLTVPTVSSPSTRSITSTSPRKELNIISPNNHSNVGAAPTSPSAAAAAAAMSGNDNNGNASGVGDKIQTSLAAEDLAFLTDPRQVARAAAGLIIQRNKADANAIHRSLQSALHTF
jgi:hypothetical protein